MLYIVPTPIGNLQDITLRAINIFEQVEFVLCEDGRVTSKLFNLLKIQNKPTFINIVKDNQFNYSGVKFCLENNLIKDKNSIALLSDAGTPCISDPGFEVIKLVQELNIKYSVLPGATAFVPAIVASGFGGGGFEFIGFLPLKKGRQTVWNHIKETSIPVILYESVHRISKFLDETRANLEPERQICICQEISKMNEQYFNIYARDLENFKITEKGEFVIVINTRTKNQKSSEI